MRKCCGWACELHPEGCTCLCDSENVQNEAKMAMIEARCPLESP